MHLHILNLGEGSMSLFLQIFWTLNFISVSFTYRLFVPTQIMMTFIFVSMFESEPKCCERKDLLMFTDKKSLKSDVR